MITQHCPVRLLQVAVAIALTLVFLSMVFPPAMLVQSLIEVTISQTCLIIADHSRCTA